MGRNRFPAKRTIVDGFTFASKREAQRYGELKLLQIAGEIKELRLQPAFPVFINGVKYCTYTADFSYRNVGDDQLVVEDTKSSGTRKDTAYRLRKKAAELSYGMKVTEVL